MAADLRPPTILAARAPRPPADLRRRRRADRRPHLRRRPRPRDRRRSPRSTAWASSCCSDARHRRRVDHRQRGAGGRRIARAASASSTSMPGRRRQAAALARARARSSRSRRAIARTSATTCRTCRCCARAVSRSPFRTRRPPCASTRTTSTARDGGPGAVREVGELHPARRRVAPRPVASPPRAALAYRQSASANFAGIAAPTWPTIDPIAAGSTAHRLVAGAAAGRPRRAHVLARCAGAAAACRAATASTRHDPDIFVEASARSKLDRRGPAAADPRGARAREHFPDDRPTDVQRALRIAETRAGRPAVTITATRRSSPATARTCSSTGMYAWCAKRRPATAEEQRQPGR